MRRSFLIILLIVIPILVIAQSTKYYWMHELAITTSAVDSTFSTQWEVCVIYADTVDAYLRIGAPDDGSWSSREWLLLTAGNWYAVGPYPKLTRLEYKTLTGSGKLYLSGYKKSRQY